MRQPRRTCVDCEREGITTKRKIAIGPNGNPVPGPRCVTHHRAIRRSRSTNAWEKRLIATYGITAEEYNAIYEAQGGVCYICQRASGVRKRLSVDHDHETGYVRGLLCGPCNRDVVGHLRDDPEAFLRGVRYLTQPPAFDIVGRRVAPIEANRQTGGEA